MFNYLLTVNIQTNWTWRKIHTSFVSSHFHSHWISFIRPPLIACSNLLVIRHNRPKAAGYLTFIWIKHWMRKIAGRNIYLLFSVSQIWNLLKVTLDRLPKTFAPQLCIWCLMSVAWKADSWKSVNSSFEQGSIHDYLLQRAAWEQLMIISCNIFFFVVIICTLFSRVPLTTIHFFRGACCTLK